MDVTHPHRVTPSGRAGAVLAAAADRAVGAASPGGVGTDIDMAGMKGLLGQLTSAGRVTVGRTPDGIYEVMWGAEVVASRASLAGALEAACARPWSRPCDQGQRTRTVQVSTSPEHRFIAA